MAADPSTREGNHRCRGAFFNKFLDGRRLATYQYTGYMTIALVSRNVYFGNKLIYRWRSSGESAAVMEDRIGSGVNGTSYYPYGEEPVATSNVREKFATYFRDPITGLDYAQQRYYAPGIGRFTTPDPSASAETMVPQSWNRYAYVENDPVNSTDPTGLVRCGDLVILGTGTTLGEAIGANSTLGLLSRLVWAESDHTWSRQGTPDYYSEQDAIVWSVLNRWRILNGFLSVSGFSNPAWLGWGPYGASIGQILGQPYQYATIAGGPSDPHLTDKFQSNLNRVLDEEPTAGDHVDIQVGFTITSMTHNCVNVWQSWVTASFALRGGSADPLADKGYTTSFHHGFSTTQSEPHFGDFGTENNFFGVPSGQVTVNPIPRRPPRRRIPAPLLPGRSR